MVSREGSRLDLNKVEVILQFPTPQIVTNVKCFNELTNYYCTHIRSLGSITQPLYALSRAMGEFQRIDECEKEFMELKKRLTNEFVLVRLDLVEDVFLEADWNTKGIGAIVEYFYKRCAEGNTQ